LRETSQDKVGISDLQKKEKGRNEIGDSPESGIDGGAPRDRQTPSLFQVGFVVLLLGKWWCYSVCGRAPGLALWGLQLLAARSCLIFYLKQPAWDEWWWWVGWVGWIERMRVVGVCGR